MTDTANEKAGNEADPSLPYPITNPRATASPVAVETAPPAAVERSGSETNWRSFSFLLCMGIVCVMLVLILVLNTWNNGSDAETGPPPTPTAVDYSTGVSLVTYYSVEAVIRSRLARTKVIMEVTNALDCSSIHSVTMQLPLGSRVASLQTITDEGCRTNGEVQKLEEARETFLDSAKDGFEGAYIEAQDAFTYGLQVSIPPLGSTRVEVVLEQLLKQRLGEVEFQIPLIPNDGVDIIVLDITVDDVSEGPTTFHLQNLAPDVLLLATTADVTTDTAPPVANLSMNETYAPAVRSETTGFTSGFQIELGDARSYDLPAVLRGSFQPNEIPEEGILTVTDDGACFEHYFRPASFSPMKRNIVFLLDTARAYKYFEGARKALAAFVNTLTPQDTFTIQTFDRRGTKELWGPKPATEASKKQANAFIRQASTGSSYESNLHEAFLEGLLRAKRDAAAVANDSNDTVTILMVVSGSRPSYGESNPSKIAEHIYRLNQEDGNAVKIFSMGWQDNANIELLSTIAIMNGGVSVPLRDGDIDYSDQIQAFVDSEFGNVLMSDVKVDFEGGAFSTRVYGETQHSFALLSNGYETVVRGLLGNYSTPQEEDNSLRAVTTAATADGIKKWSAMANQLKPSSSSSTGSLCFQSYAHSRITELLRLRDAANIVPASILTDLVSLTKPCEIVVGERDFADCIEDEALSLAIEAKVVVMGLTAMVTIDDEQCLSFRNETEICLAGTSPGGAWESDQDSAMGAVAGRAEKGGTYDYSGAESVSYRDNYGSSASNPLFGDSTIVFFFHLMITMLCVFSGSKINIF